MNVLFITLLDIRSIDEHNLYADLMREIAKNGHNVWIISPVERRYKMPSELMDVQGDDWHANVHILKLKTGNIQKTNFLEKGISTVLLEGIIKKGIKKYLSDIKFDLVLYSTPPITLVKPINYVKKRDGARTYLLLKDIFPQNAVDLNIMQTNGLKGLLYSHFRKKEKLLYAISDRIGCMSPANVDYLLKNNPEIASEKVEIFPNSIEVRNIIFSDEEKTALRRKYDLPIHQNIFVYGGNLGRPQDIPFIIDCLRQCKDMDAFFLIVGSGTEYGKLENFIVCEKPKNVKLIKNLPNEEYTDLITTCNAGLIFLDHRFTIPNFPSRILSYMQAKLPVIACTDPHTDIGKIVVDGGFGWWCESKDAGQFKKIIDEACGSDLMEMGKKSFDYLCEHYAVSKCTELIIS